MFVTSFKLEYVEEHRSEEERNFLLTGEANLILKQRHVEDQTVKSVHHHTYIDKQECDFESYQNKIQ